MITNLAIYVAIGFGIGYLMPNQEPETITVSLGTLVLVVMLDFLSYAHGMRRGKDAALRALGAAMFAKGIAEITIKKRHETPEKINEQN